MNELQEFIKDIFIKHGNNEIKIDEAIEALNEKFKLSKNEKELKAIELEHDELEQKNTLLINEIAELKEENKKNTGSLGINIEKEKNKELVKKNEELVKENNKFKKLIKLQKEIFGVMEV